MGYLHAPGSLTWHALWVWGLAAALAVTAAGSLGVAGARRIGGAWSAVRQRRKLAA